MCPLSTTRLHHITTVKKQPTIFPPMSMLPIPSLLCDSHRISYQSLSLKKGAHPSSRWKKTSKNENATLFSKQAQMKHTTAMMHRHPCGILLPAGCLLCMNVGQHRNNWVLAWHHFLFLMALNILKVKISWDTITTAVILILLPILRHVLFSIKSEQGPLEHRW